ncbi:hypothetical protein IYR97_25620 (plasmid) [Pseudomonas fulva]|uniref:Uncharacterized protein n=3 Tax=Pseudomonas TaxID=286 RepID=A0A1X0ZGW8_PSEPU|nr:MULTISPECIES: hypothetical protein [Pseudomonas]MCT8181470.1 hypothetical protein [Pseudomonas sp. HD6421]MCT8162761.1 hypothetical protein [Pseudomonas sp. HD6422]MDH1928938.1 hypothetical protein [Pseudomonas sp. GD03696]MDM1712530.1 hypothetical protein [Pseudomonas sp. 165]ORL52084.1 hypothetical protein B7H18_08620 [Pseudomonas putida]
MKHALSILALMIGCQAAYASNSAYNDSALARNQALSPFDRSYEAGRAQNINQPVDYQQTKPANGLQLDLSVDDPVISVQETETERKYRQTLADLEANQKSLVNARKETERQLEAAKATAEATAAKRRDDLLAQQAEIERALELNRQAQHQAERVKYEQVADIANIKAQSDQLLMLAENNAEVIESAAHKRVILERIDPTVVMNEPVTAEYQAATIKEIVSGIMPTGWRVETDFNRKPELEIRRYQFVSTDARDLALRHLTASVRDAKVRYQYFWDLKDAQGNPSPMILLTDRP